MDIIEEIKRRIESIKEAQNKSELPINREAIGALSELEDLLETIEE
tara:strand:- start:791 stop:928 length:138 start_codon:yes stop_codon:yes gene_type:complete